MFYVSVFVLAFVFMGWSHIMSSTNYDVQPWNWSDRNVITDNSRLFDDYWVK